MRKPKEVKSDQPHSIVVPISEIQQVANIVGQVQQICTQMAVVLNVWVRTMPQQNQPKPETSNGDQPTTV